MVMIRHTFDLRIRYEQFPDTRPAMAYDGDIESDRDRILAWIMEALPGCIADDQDGDECATLVGIESHGRRVGLWGLRSATARIRCVNQCHTARGCTGRGLYGILRP